MAKKKRFKAYLKAFNGRLRKNDLMLLALENVALTFLLSWVFYDSMIMMPVLLAPVSYANTLRLSAKRSREFERLFSVEYKELLKNLISGLESGYSVENAFLEAKRIHQRRFGDDAVLTKELIRINTSVELMMPVEKAFLAFAERHPYEEVREFAEIFSFGKRLGGNYIRNLRRSAKKLEEKIDLKQEIEAQIAEKQLELTVMSVMPMAIIVYMKLGSPDFLEPIYHNFFGAVLMTGCMVVYALAVLIGKRIVDVSV